MAGSTRRALLTAAPPSVALSALPASGKTASVGPSSLWTKWPDFIRTMQFFHPDGGAAALVACQAGVRIEDLQIVAFKSLADHAETGMEPVLMFKTENGLRAFRPRGED